jgi:hypothetical protein
VSDGFVDFAKAIGVPDSLRFTRYKMTDDKDEKKKLVPLPPGKKRYNECDSEINEDYGIHDVAKLVHAKDTDVSLAIWNAMCSADKKYLVARFSPNADYTKRQGVVTKNSNIVEWLELETWIPTRDGHFLRPSEMTRELLPADFKFNDNNGWLTAIGFGSGAQRNAEQVRDRAKLAKQLGYPADVVEELDGLPEDERAAAFSDFKADIRRRKRRRNQQLEFENESEGNREVLKAKLLERLANSPTKTREVRSRSVRTSQKKAREYAEEYLRDHYADEDGNIWCQVCVEPMPFRRRDGKPYIEKVEFLKKLGKEFYLNYLALCPTCAAMFQHAERTSDEELWNAVVSGKENPIPIELAGNKSSIQFHPRHIADIRGILSDDV